MRFIWSFFLPVTIDPTSELANDVPWAAGAKGQHLRHFPRASGVCDLRQAGAARGSTPFEDTPAVLCRPRWPSAVARLHSMRYT
jgi:hypothetical protein